MDDALYCCQANAGSGKFVHPVEPLKGSEQLPGVSHIKPGPIIANKVDNVPGTPGHPEFDPRPLLPSSEFPGVVEKILHDEVEQPRISLGDDTAFNLDLDPAVR